MGWQQVKVRGICFLDSIVRMYIVNDTFVMLFFNIARVKPIPEVELACGSASNKQGFKL